MEAVEEEFDPEVPEIRKKRKVAQNGNRNIVPNIMHQVMSFLHKKNRSEKLVKKLILKLGVEEVCSTKRFYLYQSLIK